MTNISIKALVLLFVIQLISISGHASANERTWWAAKAGYICGDQAAHASNVAYAALNCREYTPYCWSDISSSSVGYRVSYYANYPNVPEGLISGFYLYWTDGLGKRGSGYFEQWIGNGDWTKGCDPVCPEGMFQGAVSHTCRPKCNAGYYLSKRTGICELKPSCPANASCFAPYDADPDAGLTCPRSGDPISTASGNSFQTEPDFIWALGQTFARAYNSNGLLVDLGVGRGWRLPLQRRVVFIAPSVYSSAYVNDIDPDWVNQEVAVTPAYYLLERDDGKSYRFELDGRPSVVQGSNSYSLEISKNAQGDVTGFVVKDTLNTESYAADGRLNKVVFATGQEIKIDYNGDRTVQQINDGFGHRLIFNYGDNFHVTSISVNGVLNAVQYGYDTQGRLTSVTYADASQRQYFYEDSNNPYLLTGIRDENGSRYVTWRFNAAGQAISSELAGGLDKTSLDFGGDQNVGPRWTDETDPLGTVRRYTFSKRAGSWLLDGNSQPGGSGCAAASNGLTYDANGNVASRTDFNGNVTKYAFDLARNLETSRTEAFGTAQARTITTVWHPTWRLPATVTEPNRVTTFDYDAVTSNLKSKTVTSAGSTRAWRWTYGNFGQVATSTDPSGKITTYTYDTQGNLATITNPASQLTQFTLY
ncbi:DUF6531 domain-containing protein, partial [Andreprevotia sp. IGB-42]|uniref:DUF6531 domain-containing protein n=1 Tax=Andreprevotia sp. IGB-42 TaxID=2497473 RepID=UPI0015812C73